MQCADGIAFRSQQRWSVYLTTISCWRGTCACGPTMPDECKAPTGPKSFKDISSDIAKKRGPPKPQVDEQYDLCVDLTLRRFVYGSLAGLATAILMFRGRTTRPAVISFGAGVGLGSAYADCAHILGDRMIFPSFPKWPPR